jgi:hypothetical protein
MKTALQEADESEPAQRDAKGREILTPEERARREEKQRKISTEVRCKRAFLHDCVSLAQKAAVRAERVQKLVDNLQRRLGIFTESATGPNDPDVTNSFRTICMLEAEYVVCISRGPCHDLHCRELKKESYGADLLLCIGFVYVSKAKQYLASSGTFLGVGGWLHNVQGKYHVFSETCALSNSFTPLC